MPKISTTPVLGEISLFKDALSAPWNPYILRTCHQTFLRSQEVKRIQDNNAQRQDDVTAEDITLTFSEPPE